MRRRCLPALLAATIAALVLPATAAQARCHPEEPGATVCRTTCRVVTALDLAAC